MLDYKAIEIFTSEEARWRNTPVTDAVLQYLRDLKIAARCIVTRGIAGSYESGEMATGRLEILSFNMPVRIYIVLPAAQAERVCSDLTAMITDGIVALHDLKVLSYRTRSHFIPRHLKVRDVMTAAPRSVAADSPLSEAARLLLSSIFTGVPVLDQQRRPVGIITQGDLIARGGMPLRLGLLAESGENRIEAVLEQLSAHRADEVMSRPAITIEEDRPLAEAVDAMLARGVKRLPVVDGAGRLTGMLSRLDVFRTVMRSAPDWNAFRAQKIQVQHVKTVQDILRRDTHTVAPDTPLSEVIRVIDQNDLQRVAVVDSQGMLLGLISDSDLLRYFKQTPHGLGAIFSRVKRSFSQDACDGNLDRCLAETEAAAVMNTQLTKVREEMLIEEAIALMIDRRLKRLPVVDGQGRFKGMISRDSLLRTGFDRFA